MLAVNAFKQVKFQKPRSDLTSLRLVMYKTLYVNNMQRFFYFYTATEVRQYFGGKVPENVKRYQTIT